METFQLKACNVLYYFCQKQVAKSLPVGSDVCSWPVTFCLPLTVFEIFMKTQISCKKGASSGEK